MCRKPAHAATATVLAKILGPVVLMTAASPALAGWPFSASKPAPAPTPPAQTTAAGEIAASKASPAQRAAADRLNPLARSAFWAREVNLDPTDVRAGVELATALRLLGRYEEAVQATSRVLVVDPKNLDALLESGRAYIGAGKGFYALDPLKRAAAAAPGDWRAFSLLGVAREQNQQPEEARAAYLQALRLSPANPGVLSNLGLWYAAHSDATQAETLLRQAVAQPSASPQERQNLALVLGMQGKLADAERLMREDLPPEIADGNLDYLKAVSNPTR